MHASPLCDSDNAEPSFEFPRPAIVRFETRCQSRSVPPSWRPCGPRGDGPSIEPLERGLRDKGRSVNGVLLWQQAARLRAPRPADDLEAAVEVVDHGRAALD